VGEAAGVGVSGGRVGGGGGVGVHVGGNVGIGGSVGNSEVAVSVGVGVGAPWQAANHSDPTIATNRKRFIDSSL
jgi:hypothetical protein